MKRDWLAWAALVAALAVTASAEYHLARACGFGQWMSAGVPAALDIYAVRALRVHRDVFAVVVAMIAVNAASHLVTAGLLPVSVPLVVAVSAIAPLVLWRVHALREDTDRDAEPVPVPVEEEAVPAPVPAEPRAVPGPAVEPPALPVLGPVTALPWAVQDRPGTGGGTDLDREFSALLDEPEEETGTAGTGTAPSGTGGGTEDTDSGTADGPPSVFEQRVTLVRNWLAEDPELTGTAIGHRLGTTDGYGRRVRRAALNGHPS